MRVVIVLVVTTVIGLFAYFVENKKKRQPTEAVYVPGNRMEILEQVYIDLKDRREKHLALPTDKQNKWLLQLIERKLKEVEAEFLLNRTI